MKFTTEGLVFCAIGHIVGSSTISSSHITKPFYQKHSSEGVRYRVAPIAFWHDLIASGMAITMTLANFVGIDCSAASPSSSTNQRSFFSTNSAADARAGHRRSNYCQLISVFLPKRSRMPMASATRLCRSARQGEPQNHEHQYYD
jgi:hypothetical protein